jgi:LysM repeat protein
MYNHAMRRSLLPVLMFVIILLSACQSVDGNPVPVQVPGDLQPYTTMTPSPTAQVTLQVAETALPTSTPLVHKVAAGETLGDIAIKYGIDLETLQAANPGVNPSALSIGQELRIPNGPDDISREPSPTPEPVTVSQVACYPTIEGGMWCFALVRNDFPDTLEDLSAQITLTGADGRVLASQAAIPPLNILPPGQSLPLTAFFPDVSADAQPRLQLLTAIRLLPGDERYLPVSLQNTLTEVDWRGQSAQVSGKVVLAGDSKAANQIWLAAVAYDVAGNVVGVRRWESTAKLGAGESLPFSFEVSSLGAPIERVDLVAEARP